MARPLAGFSFILPARVWRPSAPIMAIFCLGCNCGFPQPAAKNTCGFPQFQDGFRAGANAELGVDILQVKLNRAEGNAELRGNLLIALALQQ